MSERHLAQRMLHTVAFLQDISRRLTQLTKGTLHPSNPHFVKTAQECERMAEQLRKALHAEGYDRVY